MEGIRLVNEKLGDPKNAIDDEPIISICHLIGLEVIFRPFSRHSGIRADWSIVV